jgi:PIN domain nuclease of toxin-antitoxin system
VNYLIDTHILLWYIVGDKRITQNTQNKIEHTDNTVFLSNASLWEIAIKLNIGKLKLNGSLKDLEEYLSKKGVIILEFDFEDLEMLQSLPFHHQDPFDRIIISQAKSKSMEIISNDKQVLKYFKGA